MEKARKIRKKLALARAHIKNPGYGQPMTNARVTDATTPPAHQQRFHTHVEHLERMLDQRLSIDARRKERREAKAKE